MNGRVDDDSESPETEGNAVEEPQHRVPLTTPLQLNAQVGNPSIELCLVMSTAAHAIADPCRQHLAAGDALS